MKECENAKKILKSFKLYTTDWFGLNHVTFTIKIQNLINYLLLTYYNYCLKRSIIS